MKRLAAVCFTRHGALLLRQLQQKLSGWEMDAYTTKKLSADAGLPSYEGRLADWAELQFKQADGILFVGALGIAVRAIAPMVSSKKTDPAVVVLDEKGDFCISVLSGHLGGANRLTHEVAQAVGAVPVITTATDRNEKFSVDQWAGEHGCTLLGWDNAKEFAAWILDGGKAGLVSRFPVEGTIPEELTGQNASIGIAVTLDEQDHPFEKTVQLIPKTVVLGIGCRKGTQKQVICQQVTEALKCHKISPLAVSRVATIDLKAEEPGLLEFCREQGWELVCYSAEELSKAKGEFTPSAFVSQITGVDNVCERAASLASGGKQLFPKQKGNGVTVSAGLEPFQVLFE
ncbi:MAG: cobalt-precorrin 5A hydrolase [Massiliimalia sp.]